MPARAALTGSEGELSLDTYEPRESREEDAAREGPSSGREAMTCALVSLRSEAAEPRRGTAMSSPAARVWLHLFVLTCVVSAAAGFQKLTITPDRGATINISSAEVKGCQVCMVAGRSRRCSSSLLLKDAAPVSVEFDCSRPQDVFRVEVGRSIECTAKSCSGNIVLADSGSLPLLDFNRRFTWRLEAAAPKALKIDFAEAGLRQIDPSESCPDGHAYTLQALQATGSVAVGTYCRTGAVSSAQILNLGSLSLEVPAGRRLQTGRFDVSVGEEIKSLAKITLTLPKGTSSAELLSPNYPESFPDDDVMEWHVEVPRGHEAAVRFSNVTQPGCLKKEAAVEYHGEGRAASVLRLTQPQPRQSQGGFSLTLRNCEMDRRRAGAPGLSLRILVSASSADSPVQCKVDLSKVPGLSLRIEKLTPASDCRMQINSVAKENITVASSGELSFQDCLPGDVRVTALRVIECSRLKDCPKTVRLALPALPSCLPAPLSSATWVLRPPPHGTVELTSPTGPLRRHLPGQPCNGSAAIIDMAEDDGTAIGRFCPQGAVRKVQIHANASVTVSGGEGEALRTAYRNALDACFKEEISERYIFTVSSKKDGPVLLATPGWPVGMKSYSTVSWIVSVPQKMEAHLMFATLQQPKCSNRHTNIRVQRVGVPEEEYSRREDEEAESQVVVSETFYLNMSNCMPETGQFRVITEVTLQKSKNFLLMVVLSVLAALLVVFVIVLAAVCAVIRKKKRQLNHQVSIYNPNGTSFLPGSNHFPKTREDNESHVYASIDDTLVYTHLLRKGAEVGIYGESDTYRPFPGHADSQKPLVPANGMEVGVYRSFQYPEAAPPPPPPQPNRPASQSLVDNELYQLEDQSEEEPSPALGPRLEPEGGN